MTSNAFISAPGVWRIRVGEDCESATPVSLRRIPPDLEALNEMPQVGKLPIRNEEISFEQSARGLLIRMPLRDEDVYGFGLQLKSVRQTGKKRVLRVNSDPITDSGDSHAPVPFFVTTGGWGVLIDTARYATFYLASHARPGEKLIGPAGELAEYLATGTEDLYGEQRTASSEIVIEVPHVRGVDLFLFGGPTLLDAMRRYVLFSGGGVLPPWWSLGVWYRTYGRSRQDDVLKMARDFRDSEIPCDVIGLEPGWQSHAYSCSFSWNQEAFPAPMEMLESLKKMDFKVNLWEHAFVHPSSPIYDRLKSLSGSIAVWDGLVPDFSLPETREVFISQHTEEFIAEGIAGFKLDECDNSDFLRYPWSFPEYCTFPSGMDGEQMHSMFGTLYASTIAEAFQKSGRETLCQSRSLGALASPIPAVVYSDLYDFKDYLRGVVNAGFSGLLWCPEVRNAESREEWLSRVKLAVVSPQLLINGWMLPLPPWRQVDIGKNLAGELEEGWQEFEGVVQELLQFRSRIVPYLFSAFGEYRQKGTPVCRALVCDFPEDRALRNIEDQFLLGSNLMVAPIAPYRTEREVVFPRGLWIDLETGEQFQGPSRGKIVGNRKLPPIFVRSGTLLPMARPQNQIGHNPVFEIDVVRFGDGPIDPFRLLARDHSDSKPEWLELIWSDLEEPSCHPQTGPWQDRFQIASWVKWHPSHPAIPSFQPSNSDKE